jgi:hypothetical protein
MIKSWIARAAAVVTSRQARLVTILTLGLGILAIPSHHHTGVISTIGFGLIVLSLPSRGYALHLRTLPGKRRHGIDPPKRSR